VERCPNIGLIVNLGAHCESDLDSSMVETLGFLDMSNAAAVVGLALAEQ
jgi:hypothetical protein